MTFSIKRGATSQIILFKAYDTTSVLGAGKTGLTTASFTSAYFTRSLLASAVAISLDGTMVAGTWKTGGLVELDSLHLPGWYALGLPNAAVDASDASPECAVVFVPTVVAGAYVGEIHIPLVAFDPQTATQPVNVIQWNAHAVPAENVNGVPKVDVVDVLGTASAGVAGYIAPDWAHINAPTTVQDLSGTTVKNVDNAIANVTLVATTTNLTNAPPDSAGVTTLLARIGAFAGSGVNTVLGFLKAALSKTASTPSDIGGTFTAAADSNESIVAAIGSIPTADPLANPLPGAYAAGTAGADIYATYVKALALGAVTVTVQSPADASGNITVTQGQDNLIALGNAVQLTFTGIGIDPTTADLKLSIYARASSALIGTSPYLGTCISYNAGTSTAIIAWEFTDAQTKAFAAPNTSPLSYEYDFEAKIVYPAAAGAIVPIPVKKGLFTVNYSPTA